MMEQDYTTIFVAAVFIIFIVGSVIYDNNRKD